MKLKEYFENLKTILNDNPQYGELEVVYSADDEGNDYKQLMYNPVLGNFYGKYSGDFMPVGKELKTSGLKVNAICIN